ncbi:MAG TPA: SufS family cysteine desulfurase [Chloroflexota bacterium]|nr:SufS family cysteine desulfurase [Chloroflexota bacterium]
MMTTDLASPLDVAAIRRDFPILSGATRLIYLDSAATSQKPRPVIERLARYYETQNANVHRGVYRLAEEATAAYEEARATLARFIGARPEETIFVRNATEGINLVANTWGAANIGEGDVIVLTEMEHHSNLIPWQLLAERTGAQLRYIGLTPDGRLQPDALEEILAGGRVKLVATTYVSNVLGTVNPIADMSRAAHAAGARILVDAAQAAPHFPLDVRRLDVDFLALTGHKMLGPMGIGVLYGRQEILDAMPPFLGGGEMIRRVGREHSTWNDLPWKFEAGTPNVEGAVGLAEAVRYLESVGLEAIAAHDRRLAAYALSRLREIPGLIAYGPEERGALVAFTLPDIHPHDLASLLDERDIAVRAGHHCAQVLHERLDVPATTRASFYLYNDERDVDTLVQGIGHAREVME